MIDFLAHYGPFLIAALLLNVAPGPDLAFVTAQAAAHGRKIGVMSSLGVCSGAFVHVVFAALGLSAILMTSAVAFAVVKWIGVAYLVWIGIGTLRKSFARSSRRDGLSDDLASGIDMSAKAQRRSAPTIWRAWRQGVMIDVFNPKVAIFFMAFLPQFVDPALGHGPLQLFVLGTLVNLIGFVVETIAVLAVVQVVGRMKASKTVGIWLDRALGSLFIVLGVRLAIVSR